MNFLDRVIKQVSPQWAARRIISRRKAEFLQGYDGATRGRRGYGLKNVNTSANTEIRRDGKLVRARVRELVRNNPWAVRIKSVIVNNTIGTGIVPDITVKGAQKAWEMWANTTECDISGRLDFAGIERQSFGTVVEAGECIVRRVWDKSSRFPLKIQVLDPDFICRDREGVTQSGGYVRDGIEKNAFGKITHYYLYKSHPGDNFSVSTEYERVPAKDVIHMFRQDRAGQDIGISWFAPIVIGLSDFSEFEDAQLIKQKVSAKFAAFVYDSEMPMGGDYPDLSDHLEAGAIEFLPPGKDIKFPNMPTSGNYSEFAKMKLHSFTAAMGVTFESVTGFYDDTNFASGRMGFVEMDRNIKTHRREVVIPQLCRRVFEWFTEASILAGIPTVKSVMDVTWTPPRREMFDPSKEIKAQKEAILMGAKTLTGTILENGDSPDKIFEQHKKDQELLDKYGLKFDSDYRNELQKTEAKHAEEKQPV